MPSPLEKAYLALKNIPAWDSGTAKIIRSLGQGYSNDVWLVDHNSNKYVLRIDTPFTHKLPLDRNNELAVRNSLADFGLSKKVFHSDLTLGILVTPYIPGNSLGVVDLQDKNRLIKLAQTLKRLHSLTPKVKNYDLLGGLHTYTKDLNTAQAQHWSQEAAVLLSQMQKRHNVLCHNDLLAQNIIEHEQELFLIDWEYAGLGDPLFDLSTVIRHHQLDTNLRDVFLNAYSDNITTEFMDDLKRYLKVCDRLLALWYSRLILEDENDKVSVVELEKLVTRMSIK